MLVAGVPAVCVTTHVAVPVRQEMPPSDAKMAYGHMFQEVAVTVQITKTAAAVVAATMMKPEKIYHGLARAPRKWNPVLMTCLPAVICLTARHQALRICLVQI